jgi:hypothetical protein
MQRRYCEGADAERKNEALKLWYRMHFFGQGFAFDITRVYCGTASGRAEQKVPSLMATA